MRERQATCRSNRGYEAALVVGRSYRVVDDPEARRERLRRVIDESGEDYLYPFSLFEEVRTRQ